MEQNEQSTESKSVKLKSLVAGRILVLVPFASIALFFITAIPSYVFCSSTSRFAQIWNSVWLKIGGTFMTLSTIPSFLCCVVGLILLICARKKGGRKTLPFIIISIVGMILSVLLSLLFYVLMRGFESTVGQLNKLSKISAIEEFVLTYDSEEGGFHDGTMYNDLDLYLTDGGFLQVEHMSEYLTSFRLKSVGNWNFIYVYENSDKELIKKTCLEQEQLSELCGTKIKKLNDLISNYDSFIQKAEGLPLAEEKPTKTGFFKSPLKKEKLALRENVIYEDLLRQEGVVSVKKIKGHYEYLENYWYEITMNDGHTLVMTVSAVVPQDDGSLESDYCIRMFDGEPISLLSMTNTTYGINYYSPYSGRAFAKKIGVEMNSYRVFFPYYKEFVDLSDELLEESKKMKNDKNKSSGGGMISGMYTPR